MSKAIPRKRRKSKAIYESNQIYSHYLKKGDYISAAMVVFQMALKISGIDGIMKALDDANSFIRRKGLRRGL